MKIPCFAACLPLYTAACCTGVTHVVVVVCFTYCTWCGWIPQRKTNVAMHIVICLVKHRLHNPEVRTLYMQEKRMSSAPFIVLTYLMRIQSDHALDRTWSKRYHQILITGHGISCTWPTFFRSVGGVVRDRLHPDLHRVCTLDPGVKGRKSENMADYTDTGMMTENISRWSGALYGGWSCTTRVSKRTHYTIRS